jgi:hypothetical protein
MYKIFRDIHLLLGLFAGIFLLMYGISAVQMAHNRWFNLRPSVSEQQIALEPGVDEGARLVANFLMTRHEMRGELAQVRESDKGIRFRIARPGTVYEVDYDRGSRSAKIRTSTANFLGMLNRIHHLAGVNREFWVLNVWGWLVGIVSAMLIGMGITGIYLWFKIHTERRVGMALLVLSLGYSLPLLYLLRNP